MLTWQLGARRADVACGTSVPTRHGTEATWQGRTWPTRGAGGADMWQEATRVHADAREGRHVAEWGWHVKGPRVSGPWLEYWGGNTIALNRPVL